MARHDDPGHARRPQREQDREHPDGRPAREFDIWRAERTRPAEEEEPLQSPGAKPLKKTQQQQH
jgi:hypothetical protein